MDWELERQTDILIVRPRGELDLHTTSALKRDLQWELQLQPHTKVLLFNLSRLRFIDSSGIGLILTRIRTMHNRGGQVVLAGLSPHMKKVLSMAGVMGLVKVCKDEKEVLSRLKRGVI